jgi:hypothetical protein
MVTPDAAAGLRGPIAQKMQCESLRPENVQPETRGPKTP